MSLMAYNLTTNPVVLAAGNPAPTLPASTRALLPGAAVNVTGYLQGLSGAQYAALEVQRPSTVKYIWTDEPEFDVSALTVTCPQSKLTGNAGNANGQNGGGFYWLTDYGAVGDGVTDCSVQWNNLFTDLLANGGGTCVIPYGKFYINNVVFCFPGLPATDVNFLGMGDASQVLIDTSTVHATLGFDFGNCGNIRIESVQFVCSGSGFVNHVDCTYGIFATGSRSLILVNTNFWGLDASQSVVHMQGGTLSVKDCNWIGCIAGGAALDLSTWEGSPIIEHCFFFDVGNLNGGFYSKTPFGSNVWIRMNDSADGGSGPGAGQFSIKADSSNTISIRDCGFDEGANPSIQFNPSTGAVRYQGVSIENCDSYGGQGSTIYDIKQCNKVSIRRCGFNTRSLAAGYNIVKLQGCNQSIIEELRTVGQPTPAPGPAIIYADNVCGDVQIIECDYDYINSAATNTTVTKNGIRAPLLTGALVTAGQLVKPSGTNQVPLVVGDDGGVATGIALDTTSKATGTITTDTAANIVNGSTITISDGHHAVIFQWWKSGAVTPGNIKVDISAAVSANDTAAALNTAINATHGGGFTVTSTVLNNVVTVTNDDEGQIGNVPMIATTPPPSQVLSGMTGGNNAVRVGLSGQIVPALSDGTAIGIGVQVYRSGVTGGDLSATVGGTARGVAITAAGAGAPTLFTMAVR